MVMTRVIFQNICHLALRLFNWFKKLETCCKLEVKILPVIICVTWCLILTQHGCIHGKLLLLVVLCNTTLKSFDITFKVTMMCFWDLMNSTASLCLKFSKFFPLTSMIWSPTLNPAFSAGEPRSTLQNSTQLHPKSVQLFVQWLGCISTVYCLMHRDKYCGLYYSKVSP